MITSRDLMLHTKWTRDNALEEAASMFDDQANSMEMCFEQRLLRTVAERIRKLKSPDAASREVQIKEKP